MLAFCMLIFCFIEIVTCVDIISTFAGTGSASFSGDGSFATSATVSTPTGIVIDASGNIFFNEYGNHRMRKVTTSTGIISTYVGTGSTSYSGDGGVASSATIYCPHGLAIDVSGINQLLLH